MYREIRQSRVHICWLFIAWVFGWDDAFKYVATGLVRNLELGDNIHSADPQTAFGEGVRQSPMPLGNLKNILSVRVETIRKLLDIPYSLVAKFKNNKNELCQVGSCPDCPACGALMYDSVLRGLGKRNL
jgi:hypothetical protein